MILRYLPAALVLVSAMALLSLACDNEESSSDYTDDAGTTANASGDGDSDEADSGPIAPQMFESTKLLMAEQVEGMATQVDTLTKVAADYKDEQLDALLKEAVEKVAACRAKLGEVTQANSGTTLTKELPALTEEAGKVIERAMLRMQGVGKAKMGGGGS